MEMGTSGNKQATDKLRLSVSKRTLRLGHLSLGLALTLIGCQDTEPNDVPPATSSEQSIGAFNGIAWNGLAWNGAAWNGLGWNGLSWNGLGWNGLAWNGLGWNGAAWNGAAWNGLAWNGAAWNGLAWNGVSGQDSPVFTTLHNWINHQDANGNGTPTSSYVNQCGPRNTYSSNYLNDNEDMMARISALSYWVSCACAANVEIPFSDTHGRFSTTFYGGMGLAPTWCGSNQNATVPESEIQIVSACLMARVNTKGKHFPLSLLSWEMSTQASNNEGILLWRPLAKYFGNLWKQPHSDTDTTTAYSTNLSYSGSNWWNMERFSASGWGGLWMRDQIPFGRDCESSDCGGHLEHLGPYGYKNKQLGDLGAWDPNAPGVNLYKAVATTATSNLNTPGGLETYTAQVPGLPNGFVKEYAANYRGRSWRVMSVNGPDLISIEDPYATLPAGKTSWAQVEPSSAAFPSGQSAECPTPAVTYYLPSYNVCEGRPDGSGTTQAGRRLLGMNNSQALSLNFSINNTSNAGVISLDQNEPVSIAIRYQRLGLLGDGQCNPNAGCADTLSSECLSGVVSSNGLGCIGGVANPGKLKIWAMSNRPNSTSWALVHGTGVMYGKNIFPPTTNNTAMYSTAYIYPVYAQDSGATITGAVDNTPGVVKTDTLRVKIQGETLVAGDAPYLDAAYYFPGPPPSDADCKGPNGCWMYAGPSISMAVAQNAYYTHQTPFLPQGTYTFVMTPAAGADADLYVKVNQPAAGTLTVTDSSYTCRPYYGAGAVETCTVTIGPRGGDISVAVKGYSAGSSLFQLVGTN